MSWLWIGLAAFVASLAVALLLQWAKREEQRFYADEARVAAAKQRLARRASWMPALTWAGALGGSLALLMLLLGVGLLVIAYFVRNPLLVSISVLSILAGVTCAILSLPAVFLCLCPSCAGYIFDNGQPARKGNLGPFRENWRILQGRGRCPRCEAPLSPPAAA